MSEQKEHMVIVTRRIEVHLHHDAEADPDKVYYRAQWEQWRTINDNLYLAANRISSHLFFTDEFEHRLQVQHPRFLKIEKILRSTEKRKQLSKEELEQLRAEQRAIRNELKEKKRAFLQGMSERNATYRLVSDEFGGLVPSDVLTCLNQNMYKTYGRFKKEVSFGQRTLANYKKGIPVPFSMNVEKHSRLQRRSDGSIFVSFPGGAEWDLAFGRDRSDNRSIVERILSGEYDACNSTLQEKGNKVFLLLVVSMPASRPELNPERVVGVDLGLAVPLYAALNDDDRHGHAIGSRDGFLKVRCRMNARYRQLQRSLRTSTQGGRGRTHKLQALERFRETECNWVHTQNHIFSREVVEFAKSHRAGVIQMERLSGFGRDKEHVVKDDSKFVLRYWSYFELQTLIAEKANREGIVVRYVNPRNTSRTCSFCGHCDAEQRVSQSVFVCANPACERGKGELLPDGSYKGINADWNAARNIALSCDVVKEKT